MATKSTDTTTSLRLSPELRALCELHGCGELAEGVRKLLTRHQDVMRRALPALDAEECKAICGACKGYPLWADPEISPTMAMGPALALEVHDYQWCERVEAEQWHPDWAALETRCAALTDIEVMALAHAVEAFFQDREGTTDEQIARHFRLR